MGSEMQPGPPRAEWGWQGFSARGWQLPHWPGPDVLPSALWAQEDPL